MGLVARYDCHLEADSWTHASSVLNRLNDSGRSGAVLVQSSDDPSSQSCFVNTLAQLPKAFGVVRLRGAITERQVDELGAAGVCGIRLDCSASRDPWQHYDRIAWLTEGLPATWHVELSLTWAQLPALAPLLARERQIFSLLLSGDPSPDTTAEERTLRWWLDMGNVYLKLIGARSTGPRLTALAEVASYSTDRIVLGADGADLVPFAWPLSDLHRIAVFADNNAERLYGFTPSRTKHH